MIIRIESKNKKLAGFSQFTWGKYVNSFNDEQHCAKCLNGLWTKEINHKMKTNTDINLPLEEGKPYYICGVAFPWNYNNNMHLAVIGKTGAEAVLELYTGDRLIVKDAERFYFNDRKARILYPNKKEEYLTCRCFQFGVQFFKNC